VIADELDTAAFGRGTSMRRARTLGARAARTLHHPVPAMIGRRLWLSVPLLFVVSASTFVLMALVPGDVTWSILGPPNVPHHPPASAYRALAHRLGIDQPIYLQYWHWLSKALQGDLGTSLLNHQPISTTLLQRFPVTISLTLGALLVGVVVGVSLGVLSVVRGRALGRLIDVLAMAGWVLPVYWVAAELVVVFSVKLHWLPAIGYVPFAQSPSQWFRSLVMPVFALSLGPIGAFAKFTRQGMLDALATEYVRMAKACGISPLVIIFVDAFRTASLQVVTIAGLTIVGTLTGTVFAEQVFALPGLGALIVSGAQQHDVTLEQGILVFFTLIIVVVNLFTDLAYSLLSPKVRVG
jgi:peptide/nickel transport system permease protein